MWGPFPLFHVKHSGSGDIGELKFAPLAFNHHLYPRRHTLAMGTAARMPLRQTSRSVVQPV